MVVKKKFRTSTCKRGEFEDVVQNNLAVTPAQMLELTKNGFPISARNSMLLNSVDPSDVDMYVPVQYRRGSDIADVYQHSVNLRKRLKDTLSKVDSGSLVPVSKDGKE